MTTIAKMDLHEVVAQPSGRRVLVGYTVRRTCGGRR
jgi:hypothetical protein